MLRLCQEDPSNQFCNYLKLMVRILFQILQYPAALISLKRLTVVKDMTEILKSYSYQLLSLCGIAMHWAPKTLSLAYRRK